MTRRWARPVVLAAIAVVTVYLCLAALPATMDVGAGRMLFLAGPMWYLVPVWYLVPGAIVLLRHDWHIIGWLLALIAVLFAVQLGGQGAGGGLAWISPAWRAWMIDGGWLGNALGTTVVALVVLFPDGLAKRSVAQQRAGRAMIAVALVVTVLTMFPTEVGGGLVPAVYPNPTGLGFIPTTVSDLLIILVTIPIAGSVLGLWHRARRVTGVQRRQYTWVLFAFALVVAGFAIGLTGSGLGFSAIVWLPIVIGWFMVPVAFSIAILRYRLYDIDRIVSRTVAYAVITVVVAGVYTGTVVTLPELFEVSGPLHVAAATLAAAAAFSPVRRVVQRWVDRRFNRAHFDAQQELDAFAVRLRSQVELDAILAEVDTLIAATLQPEHAGIWIRPAPRMHVS
jgi:hypothetical protein